MSELKISVSYCTTGFLVRYSGTSLILGGPFNDINGPLNLPTLFTVRATPFHSEIGLPHSEIYAIEPNYKIWGYKDLFQCA